MIDSRIQVGHLYRHITGNIYRICLLAKDCHDSSKIYVIYQDIENEQLKGEFIIERENILSCEYNEFIGKIDLGIFSPMEVI